MISGRLTMRAHLERNVATAKDSWGAPVEPDFQPVEIEPCFVWSTMTRDVEDGRKDVVIEDVRIMLSLSTEALDHDEIALITDRQGTVLFPGRWRIEGGVQFKHNHREAALRRVS